MIKNPLHCERRFSDTGPNISLFKSVSAAEHYANLSGGYYLNVANTFDHHTIYQSADKTSSSYIMCGDAVVTTK